MAASRRLASSANVPGSEAGSFNSGADLATADRGDSLEVDADCPKPLWSPDCESEYPDVWPAPYGELPVLEVEPLWLDPPCVLVPLAAVLSLCVSSADDDEPLLLLLPPRPMPLESDEIVLIYRLLLWECDSLPALKDLSLFGWQFDESCNDGSAWPCVDCTHGMETGTLPERRVQLLW